ncbi:MAG: alpha/beta hydrolase [Cellvibrionaceae bacterium]
MSLSTELDTGPETAPDKNNITLVLIRGLLREKRHWGDFPPHLMQAFESTSGKKVSVITVNIAGNGDRFKEQSSSSIGEMVEDLRRQVAGQLGQDAGPLWLIALSMGGMIATEWGHQYPDEVTGIVLINTSAAQFSPLYQRLKVSNLPAIIRALCTKSSEVRESLILNITSNEYSDSPQVLASWMDIAQTAPVTRENALTQLRAAAAYKGRKSPPEVPVLILASRQDRLVSAQCSKRIAEQWRVPISEHHTAGHDLPLDAPQWLAQKILTFVCQQAPS